MKGESEPRPPTKIATIETTTAPSTMKDSGRAQPETSLLQAKPAAPMPTTVSAVSADGARDRARVGRE